MSEVCKCGKKTTKRESVGPEQRAHVSWTVRVGVCECGRYTAVKREEFLPKTQRDWIARHNKTITDKENENIIPAG